MASLASAPAASFEHFRVSVDGAAGERVATVLLDVAGEKMNTLSAAVGRELERILELLEGDTGVDAVVLGSGKPKSFIAGADIRSIRELTSSARAAELATQLQQGFARIAALHLEQHKPVIAAIGGACLGGGLELALACSGRVAAQEPHVVLGLPEVKIGLLPAAGGTQRLPRLIGVAAALDLILSGRHARPPEALRLGLVDEVVPGAILLEVARRHALAAARGRPRPAARRRSRLQELQRLALEANPAGRAVLFRQARAALLQKTGGHYPAPVAALECIKVGQAQGMAAGLREEARRFGELVVSPEARALISIFFAQRELDKDNGTDDASLAPAPVRKVGLLGGGLMGGGIAAVTAQKAKLPVRLKDVDDAAVARGLGHVQQIVDKEQRRRRARPAERDQVLSLVTGTTDLSGFAGTDVVIEAVFEDLELKRQMLRAVEAACPARTIFASNTSSLPISGIAEASAHPETVIGMHYFSPVEKMPLLEVIVTPRTAPWVTATCVQLGKDQGKTVIVVRDGPGFYTSRILAPYMNEAAWVLYEGGAIDQLDQALVDYGFPVGPVTLLDEVGIDVADKVGHVMQKAFGARLQAPQTMEALVKDGRKGRKNGRGFYTYAGGKKGGVDDSVYAVFGQGAKRKRLDAAALQRRLVFAMLNEAALCLQEGILRSPRDGDIGAVFGLGFPPFRGGPFAAIDALGAEAVLRQLDELAAQHGARFAPAPILSDYAKLQKKFRAG